MFYITCEIYRVFGRKRFQGNDLGNVDYVTAHKYQLGEDST